METLNAPTFRLRRKGQVSGPFPRTRIRLMARRGEVALTDELSLNGGQWVPVASTPLASEVTRKPEITFGGAPIPFPTAAKKKPAPPPMATLRPPPAQEEAPAPVAAPVPEDPFEGWTSAAPTYTSRHARRRPRGGGGLSAEAVLLGFFGVAALGAIVFAAFWFGRQQSEPAAPAARPAAGAPQTGGALPPASAPAFIGNRYGVWEAQGATAPTVRICLLGDGRIEVADSAISSVEEASKWYARWTVEDGVLTFHDAMGKATDTFPRAQPRQKELVGAHFKRTWRKLTLENR